MHAHDGCAPRASRLTGSWDDLVSSARRRSMARLNGGGPGAGGAAADADAAAAAAAAADFAAVAVTEPETPLSALQPYQPAPGLAPMALEAVLEGADEARQAAAAAQEGPAAPSPASLAGPFAAALQVSSPQRGGEGEGSGGGEAAVGEAAAVRRAYWEEPDPGRALAMLEDELSEVTGAAPAGSGWCFEQSCGLQGTRIQHDSRTLVQPRGKLRESVLRSCGDLPPGLPGHLPLPPRAACPAVAQPPTAWVALRMRAAKSCGACWRRSARPSGPAGASRALPRAAVPRGAQSQGAAARSARAFCTPALALSRAYWHPC